MDGLLGQACLFLGAALITVPIAKRCGLGSVLGYLIAGVVIGPVFGLVGGDVTDIQHFAEFGVVMMLFLVGLELEPRMLWEMRTKLLGLGGLQVVGTTALVTVCAMWFGQPWQIALAIGLILALSSTAIVVQTLNEKGLMQTPGGKSSFSVLLFQDIAVIPMLALMPLLALPELASTGGHDDHHGSTSLVSGLSPWLQALITAGAIGVVVLSGRYVVNPVLHYIARARLREMFTAVALFIVIGIAMLMSLVGLSPALGTFLAGVVLANSEFRHELESDLEPFKGLLLGLFFITVGAAIDTDVLFNNTLLVVALTLGIMAVKGGILALLAWTFRIRGRDAWLFALSLAQAGEFGFVLLSFATQNAVLPGDIGALLSLVVAFSMFLTPMLFIAYEQLVQPRFEAEDKRQADEIDETGTVLIAGMGRFGMIINRMLVSMGHKTVVLDHQSEQVARLAKFGVKTFFGDASRPDLLVSAGIAEARVLVVAIEDMERSLDIVRFARREYPKLHIVARAAGRMDVYRLYYAGADDIIRETFDSAVRAGRCAYEALGMHPYLAHKSAQAFVQFDRELMIRMAAYWDDEVAPEDNPAYIEEGKRQAAMLDTAMRGGRGSLLDASERGWIPPGSVPQAEGD
ncbi:MAG: monovalent cation:proton antiporter-2 (CPA2) family protein [Pseudomonadota bacterium]